MFLKNDLTFLSLALLITLGLVGVGVWWLRDNVFLKSLPNDDVMLSSQVVNLTRDFNLGSQHHFLNF